MLYQRKRARTSLAGGFFRIEGANRKVVFGEGGSDFIRLRDERGREWRGWAEKMADDSTRYRFRDADGRIVTGISDGTGITLRDERGNVWRGTID